MSWGLIYLGQMQLLQEVEKNDNWLMNIQLNYLVELLLKFTQMKYTIFSFKKFEYIWILLKRTKNLLNSGAINTSKKLQEVILPKNILTGKLFNLEVNNIKIRYKEKLLWACKIIHLNNRCHKPNVAELIESLC